MKRTAFIIGGNYCKKLKGVEEEVAAWKQFLMSSLGGCWEEDEVVNLSGKDKPSVLAEISKAKDDFYTMILFSGHGDVVKDRLGFPRTHIYLNDYEMVSELEMNPKNPRVTMVLDCCRRERKIIGESMEEFAVDEFLLNGVDTRQSYEAAIAECEMGCVKVYAAALGQQAADEDSFTRTMLACAKEYYVRGMSSNVLTVKDAVELANTELPPQQTPVYNGGRRLHHFPFAVHPFIG